MHCLSKSVDSCSPSGGCDNGELKVEDLFVDKGNGLSCVTPASHCLTKDASACPQHTPVPPDYCDEGQIVTGASSYVDSTDGMECELPSVHCVTTDVDACPAVQPLPPGFCEGGKVVKGPDSFVPAADGMECVVASIHCVDGGNCS